MKIWVLFSIYNDYNQPDHNLVAWWNNKPTFEKLANAIGIMVDVKKGHKEIGMIYREIITRFRHTEYRLLEIDEGKVTEERWEK